jgi:glycosyltransferase involved in cell wall biosynthesis
VSTSGVGTQARYLVNGLVNTGKYTFRCFGGAVKHDKYDTVAVNPDFIIKPTDGFGDPNLLRSTLAQERPDVLLLFTDPRFFQWIFEMEDEIHQVCPIAYNHLWDNPPWPEFNRVLYESTDLINCINWPTYEMVSERFPEKTNYIPHAVPPELFFPVKNSADVQRAKASIIGKDRLDHFVIAYVSRNARRKCPNDIIVSFKDFLDQLKAKHGHSKATLLLHTEPLDPEGPNLHHVIELLNLKSNVMFSKDRVSFQDMNVLYNISDTVVNRSCFAAGTKVATENGYKKIETISVGDSVMTHKGRYRKVVQTITNPPPGKALLVKASGMGEFVVTSNHNVMAIKRSSLPKDFLINESLDKFIEFSKKTPMSELSAGDYFVCYGMQREQVKEHVFDTQDVAVRNDGQEFNDSCGTWVKDNTSVARISSIKVIDYDEPVYNLTVEEDHTYVVENVTVFNCNEGFGLSILEAKMCAKPVISIKTGGLTRQVLDHETGEEYGIAIEPDVRSLVGNQGVPYILEDYISHETLTKAFMKMYEFGPEKRAEIGERARHHALKNYSINKLVADWDSSLSKLIDDRKNSPKQLWSIKTL